MNNMDEEKVKKDDMETDEDIEYLEVISKKKGARIFAWIGIVIILCLFVAAIVLAFLGSKYFIGMMALCILVPIGMYIFLWLGKLLRKLAK